MPTQQTKLCLSGVCSCSPPAHQANRFGSVFHRLVARSWSGSSQPHRLHRRADRGGQIRWPVGGVGGLCRSYARTNDRPASGCAEGRSTPPPEQAAWYLNVKTSWVYEAVRSAGCRVTGLDGTFVLHARCSTSGSPSSRINRGRSLPSVSVPTRPPWRSSLSNECCDATASARSSDVGSGQRTRHSVRCPFGLDPHPRANETLPGWTSGRSRCYGLKR